YIGSVVPGLDEHKVLISVAALAVLALVNVIGIRESAMISLVMAIAAVIVNVIVICITFLHMGSEGWTRVGDLFEHQGAMSSHQMLVGFAGAWLAFSGLESISQLSPAMKLPIK